MTQAKMPIEMVENCISSMDLGSSAFTVPWAVDIDEDLNVWIDTDYRVVHEYDHRATMLVHRAEDGSYSVEIPGNARYYPATYLDGEEYVPVTAVKIIEESWVD